MEKINNRLNRFIDEVIKNIRKPVMSILPGQLSFFLLLCIIPIFLVLGIIANLTSASTTEILQIIAKSVPTDISFLISPLLYKRGLNFDAILLIISAILIISKGTRSIMRVASTIYGTNDKFTVKSILKSFVLSILLVLLFAFMLIVPVLSTQIIKFLHSIDIISSLNLIVIFNMLKWPVSIFVIYVNLKVIYIYTPNKEIPKETATKGAAFTTISWVLVTALYSFYISNISSYNTYYGGAANLLVLMLWVYIISYIFVLGMSINASYLKTQTDLQ